MPSVLLSVVYLHEGWRIEIGSESFSKSVPSSSSRPRTLSVSLSKDNGRVDKKLIAETSVSWPEGHDPKVTWNHVDECLEFRGDINVLRLPLKVPKGLAYRIGSKVSTGKDVLKSFDRFFSPCDDVGSEKIEELIEKIELESIAGSKFSSGALKLLEHIGPGRVSTVQQQRILTLCKQENSGHLLIKFIRAGVFYNRCVRGEVFHIAREKKNPELWLAILNLDNVSEAVLVEALKVCVPEQNSGNEKWEEVLEKVFEKNFWDEKLIKELNMRISSGEAFSILLILKEKLLVLFSAEENADLFNKVVNWICAILDAHGIGLLTHEKFAEEVESVSQEVFDMVLLLDCGKEWASKMNILNQASKEKKSICRQEYFIERIVL